MIVFLERACRVGARYISPLLITSALAACAGVFNPTQPPAPILVTLPASTPGVARTLTPAEPTATPSPVTPTPSHTPPPTPIPRAQGIGATTLLWEWNEVAPPSALAVTGTRLAAIIADGRFAWLDADTGRIEGQAALWSGLLQGDSWGEVYTDGSLAVVAVRETSINPSTGLADSRARLVVFGAETNVLWSLDELGDPQHFYSAALASGPGIVVVGKWPYSFEDNALAGYELFGGEQLWEISEGLAGFQQIVHDGTRMYVLLNDLEGGAVASYDLRTGEELWRWSDQTVKQPDQISLRDGRVYVLTVDTTLALEALTGEEQWRVSFIAAPEAGLGIGNGLIYLAPAPTAQLGFRPGLVALEPETGDLVWHSLSGLLANPLALGDGVLWTVVADFDNGQVWLSGLDPITGLEQVRLLIGNDTSVLYKLVAQGTRVYVLGKTLRAFGY